MYRRESQPALKQRAALKSVPTEESQTTTEDHLWDIRSLAYSAETSTHETYVGRLLKTKQREQLARAMHWNANTVYS